MSNKHALVLLGGMWHDFDGFAAAMKALLTPAGYTVTATYDLDVLMHLDDKGYNAIISYTCLSLHREGHDDRSPELLTRAQVTGLTKWVRSGGGLLAVHGATVVGRSGPALTKLLGGEFVSHPPRFAFTVYPLYQQHPITDGIQAFTVYDEFYIERYDPKVEVLMVALDRGVAHPMVWIKSEGKGRVVHIAMGHDEKVWQLPSYGQLIRQALAWLER